MASSSNSGGEVKVFMGNGNGTFRAQKIYDTDGYNVNVVQVGDLNNDGIGDIIGAGGSFNKVYTLLGNGNGTFAATRSFATTDPESLLLDDVDSDGKLDAVVLREGIPEVGVLYGNGDGSFGRQVSFGCGASGWGGEGQSLALLDINSDGTKDLVVGDDDDHAVHLLLANTNEVSTLAASDLRPITGVSLATQSDALFGPRSDRRLPGERQQGCRHDRHRAQSLSNRCSRGIVRRRRLAGCRSSHHRRRCGRQHGRARPQQNPPASVCGRPRPGEPTTRVGSYAATRVIQPT